MKHKLTVCCGTTCYLSAKNRLDKLEQQLEQEFGDTIEIAPSGCLGQCMKHEGIPPFVKFDGEIIPNATNENIINELKKRLGKSA